MQFNNTANLSELFGNAHSGLSRPQTDNYESAEKANFYQKNNQVLPDAQLTTPNADKVGHNAGLLDQWVKLASELIASSEPNFFIPGQATKAPVKDV